MKLLWFSCCRLRLLPHGVATEIRGNRFSTEAGMLFRIGLGVCWGWLWGCEAVASLGSGSDPAEWPWCRGALIVRGRFGPAEVATEVRGNRFSTEAGMLFGACRGGCGVVKRSYR